MRPTGLTSQCARCRNFMPFDPQAQNQLCNSCNRMLALGGGFYEPDNTTYHAHNLVQSDSYSTNSHHNMSSPGYQASMYSGSSQPPMTPQVFRSTPCPIPSQASMAPQGLKRRHEISFDQQFPNKRPYEKSYAPHTPSLLRQNLSPSTIGAREAAFVNGESENEAGEEEFEDAFESQGRDAQSVAGDRDGDSEGDAEGEDEELGEVRKVDNDPERDEAGDDTQEKGEEEAEADDLFTSAFGQNAGKRSDDDADSDADSTDNSNSSTNNNKNANTTAADPPFSREALLANLTSSQPTASPAAKKKGPKPKPKSLPQADAEQQVPPPTVPRDLAHNLRKQHSFHTSSLEFLPRLPLAEHRFWIGVLKAGILPRTTQSEKNFTWMKGNRLTTVETIWNAYCGAAAEDDVVLLLGFEKPAWTVRCEELNYFADNKIVFRAVKEGHRDAGGRGLGVELVREVVAIDADEETAKDGKQGAGKGKEREVIEIEDD